MRPGDRFTVLARRTLGSLAMDSGFAYFAKRIKFNDSEVDLPEWTRERDELTNEGEEETWLVGAELLNKGVSKKADRVAMAQVTSSAVPELIGKRVLCRHSSFHLGRDRIGGVGLGKVRINSGRL